MPRRKLDESTSASDARRFFEAWFQPFEVTSEDQAEGLFTGYYEPLLHGSKRKGGSYGVPLHLPPDDLVKVDLGKFDPDLDGQSIRGRIEGQEFIPYFSRDEIVDGALAERDLELLWVDDEIEKFFLQIQGSGQVRLDDGTVMRVGYADQNGLPYRAIGRDLIEIGALTPENVSLQSIRKWLQANPNRARNIMSRNKSYIFFRGKYRARSDRRSARCPERAVDRRTLARGRSAPYPAWCTTLAGHQGALAGGRATPSPLDGRAGYRRCDQRHHPR